MTAFVKFLVVDGAAAMKNDVVGGGTATRVRWPGSLTLNDGRRRRRRWTMVPLRAERQDGVLRLLLFPRGDDDDVRSTAAMARGRK